ncbi:DIS3-like exonuclease 2 [Thelohanellus kitauei]|uniref:DIS3-like exonuclease 2 n=1 Tax=Thelohanellus kitauei TaxID=669202 RepID=A0A0C2IJ56_THEKT|nr:DIS3-like exonuclease 2 [Thelohanellus kitauei]
MDRRYLIPHGMESVMIPIKLNRYQQYCDPKSVFLARIQWNGNKMVCIDPQYIGNNNNLETQEKAIYIYAGFADRLDDVCTFMDESKIFKNIPFKSHDYRDFRDHKTFTIDSVGEYCSDTAFSIKVDQDGTHVAIHAADVCRFLNDREDLIPNMINSGSSLCLQKSWLPLVPKYLALGECNFISGALRSTISFYCTFRNGKMCNPWVGKGLIEVNHKLTYGQAEYLINNDDVSAIGSKIGSEMIEVDQSVRYNLRMLHDLAVALKKNRIDKYDSIELDLRRTRFERLIKTQVRTGITRKSAINLDEFYTPKSRTIVDELTIFVNNETAKILLGMGKTSVLFVGRMSRSTQYTRKRFKKLLKFMYSKFSEENSSYVDHIASHMLNPERYCRPMPLVKLNHHQYGFRVYTRFTSPTKCAPACITHFHLMNVNYDDEIPHFIKYTPEFCEFMCNYRQRRNEEMEKLGQEIFLNYFLNFKQPKIVDAFVNGSKLYVPEFKIVISSVDDFTGIADFSQVKVELVPMTVDGFKRIKGRIIESFSPVIDKDIIRNFILNESWKDDPFIPI